MGWHTWGGVGPYAGALLTGIENTFAGDLQGWPRRNAIAAFWKRLTWALMAFITKQLKAAEDVVFAGDNPPDVQPVALGPVFDAPELIAWDAETEDSVFVGPICIRGVRPQPEQVVPVGSGPGGASSSSSL